MKNYTAIYSTSMLKNIQYSFQAENKNNAIEYAKYKFKEYPNIAIIENKDDEEYSKSNIGKLIWLNGNYVK